MTDCCGLVAWREYSSRIVLTDRIGALISGLREVLKPARPGSATSRRRSDRYDYGLAALPPEFIRTGINWLFNDR